MDSCKEGDYEKSTEVEDEVRGGEDRPPADGAQSPRPGSDVSEEVLLSLRCFVFRFFFYLEPCSGQARSDLGDIACRPSAAAT